MERRPQNRVVEHPVADRARHHPQLAGAQDLAGFRDPVDHGSPRLAGPTTDLRGVRGRLGSGTNDGQCGHHADGEGRKNGWEDCERERTMRADADRHQDAEHRDRHEVHAALDEEERD